MQVFNSKESIGAITRIDADTIQVADSIVTIGGLQHQFGGNLTLDMDASGAGGIDNGTRVKNSIYKLFAVLDSGVLKLIASLSGSPSGFSASSLLGEICNDADDNVLVVETPEINNENILINGDMQVSQRGNYSSAIGASNGVYYIDRWKTQGTGNIQHISASQPTELVNSKSLKRIATATATTSMGSYQRVEDYLSFVGKKITLSVWVKSNNPNAKLHIDINPEVYKSSNHSGGGGWEKLTVTVQLPSSLGYLLAYVGIIGTNYASVSITSGDYIEMTGAKLEVGERVTPFEKRPFAEELQLCQRYFEKSYNYDVVPGTPSYPGTVYGRNINVSGVPLIPFRFKVEKRVTPAYKVYSETGGTLSKGSKGTGGEVDAFLTAQGTSGAILRTNLSFPAGDTLSAHWTADAEL